jgi:sec-independent protein translocase protein TatC
MHLSTTNSDEESTGPPLVYMDPSGPFLSSLHLAFFGGLILASPFVLYFLGQFVLPALKIVEKKYFLRAFWFGTILFLAGVSFAYFLVMPAAVKFSEQYAQWMGVSLTFFKAEDYFNFLIKFMLGMGLGFELPVVLLALVKIGVLSYTKLKAMRRYMIVGNLILGALLTTPEIFTQVFMAIALQVLFEVAVWIAWYWEREAKRKAAANAPIDV